MNVSRETIPVSILDTGAIFSPSGIYRYRLWRAWAHGLPTLVVIGLNPSTADAVQNDPTITRCIERGRRLGCGQLVMLNLFAYRATDPKFMKAQPDAVGPDNDEHIRAVVGSDVKKIVLCAWGVHGIFRGRDREVLKILKDLGVPQLCLGHTGDGRPRHPLYVGYDVQPQPYEPSEP